MNVVTLHGCWHVLYSLLMLNAAIPMSPIVTQWWQSTGPGNIMTVHQKVKITHWLIL